MAKEASRGLLDGVRGVLAVVAHPDDESFGLGAILGHLAAAGADTAVLCFTHGEASTLHGAGGELIEIRAAELAAAGAALDVGRTELLGYPDGRLNQVPPHELAGHVRRLARATTPSHLLAFDTAGITGHPDHMAATRAALTAAEELDLPVLGWILPTHVAAALNNEFGTGFIGRADEAPGGRLAVDRTRQWQAIACHRSQSVGNQVLYRRLELLGDNEHVRLLRTTGTGERDSARSGHPGSVQDSGERRGSEADAGPGVGDLDHRRLRALGAGLVIAPHGDRGGVTPGDLGVRYGPDPP